ncbi:MAG: PDZ domain-containing protein [Gemmatimonadetes bacterium]|nr:PDZ domain-containing protein [Gemmatimonadota bacterium]NIO33094.1 PDZ domain-containing protein [Gemmatimonadota bacterium]
MKSKIVIAIPLALCIVLSGPAELAAQRDQALSRLNDLSVYIEQLTQRVSPAVVAIMATGYSPLQQGDAPGTGLLTRRQVGGSGVILDPDGYILTNLHVVEGAGRIRVRLPIPTGASPGESILKPQGVIVGARIVGFDRETDMAVLKIEQTGLPYLELADSDEVITGQLVFAFGSPLGLENTVTMGIVSAVARQLRPEDPMIYIQTDAPINPGNSGGPLVDAEGRVIGINTLIISQSGGSEGLGFAAPSNIVRNVYLQIKMNGYVRRGMIGVNAQTINPTLAEGLGLAREWGVVLGDVYPRSPAELAGLRIGDIVLSLDGKVMENGRQFDVNIYRTPVGASVTLEVLRGAQVVRTSVTVLEREDDPGRFSIMVSPEENLVPKLGILGVGLDQRVAAMIPGLRAREGVVVAARAPDAVYGRVALAPGDVIHSINGEPITGLDQLRSLLGGIQVGEPVVLQVERRGQLQFMAFEME